MNISVICEPVSEAVVLDGLTFQSFVNKFQKQWYWMDSSVICEPVSEAVVLDG